MKNEFQYRLLKAMADKQMSATELSKRSGVGKSDISNYVNGVYVAKQDKCFLLAQALGVDPGWLMTGDEPKRQKAPIVLPDSETFRILMDYVPPEDQAVLMEIFDRAYKKAKEKGVL